MGTAGGRGIFGPVTGMDEGTPPRARAGGQFATTRWSIVLAAAGSDPPRARAALATLCEIYWYPIYAFVRGRGLPPDKAEDLTQAFFAHLIEKEGLRKAAPGKGKFRAYLLASMKNFLTDERRRVTAIKRGGGAKTLSLDAAAAEDRYRLEPAHELTPERIFERQWALTVIEQAVTRLKARYARSGKEGHFEAMKVFLTGEKRPVPYAEVARELGLTELAVKVAVHRLRKRFRDSLREEIGQTVAGKAEIDAELRALHAALEP